MIDGYDVVLFFFVFEIFLLKRVQHTDVHSSFYSLSGYSPSRPNALTKNSGKPQAVSAQGGKSLMP